MLLKEDRHDPRMSRTRARLAAALESLLSEHRFDDLTVHAIAERAAVNRATFYSHFADKYDMVNDLFRERFVAIVKQRNPAQAGTADEMLRRLFLAITDHWSGVRNRCHPTYRRFEPIVEGQITLLLRDWIEVWLLAQPSAHTLSRRRIAVTAALAGGALYGAALEWRNNGGEQPAEAYADEAVPLIAKTIAGL